jgi:hypothetical protein
VLCETGVHAVFIDPLVPDAMWPGIDLDVERVLVSHGEPVLRAGLSALRAALSEPRRP